LSGQTTVAVSAPPKVIALSVRGLSKTFGGARALRGIGFDVGPGEVHGLLGQNGSGKSTFVKILAGFHAPDPGGSIALYGQPIPLPLPPGSFRTLRLAFVHQQLALVPSLTVLENLRISTTTGPRKWVIDWRDERRAARAAFARFDLDIDITARIAELSPVDRALVAIIRAFEELREDAGHDGAAGGGLLLLDEPTPFLPKEGVDTLFRLIRQITREGSSVLFISHDIDEVLAITDRVTVLRDGEVVGTMVTRDATKERIVDMIVGRRVDRFATSPKAAVDRPVKARLSDLQGERLQPTSLDLHGGEIVGLTGLIGSGYERVGYLVFGASPATGGRITIDGVTLDLVGMTPAAAIRHGLALLPGDRQKQGGVGGLPIADNLLLLSLGRFVRRGMLQRRRMGRSASAACAEYEVRPNSPALPLAALSGGNAQKVLLAKWLSQKPAMLILDEPTQGVDVGTRQQLFRAIRVAADAGATVLCASTDFEQLSQICDRVIIFARGAVVDTLTGAEITKDAIAERCYTSTSLHHASLHHG
jgi:ribose transport system ATP-binding protein